MLRVLGSRNPFGEPRSRREVLRACGLGGLSLSVPQLLQLKRVQGAEGSGTGFGSAKRIMLLYLQGAASQFETWDPKPDAPDEIRGSLGATPTVIPGVTISSGLPKMAKLIDRCAIVRSMTHQYNNHSNVYTLTGHPTVDFSSETNPHDSRHFPFFGSVLDYLQDQDNPEGEREVPRNIALPFRFSTFSPVFRRAGPYASFLGQGYDPVWTEFHGEATRSVKRVSFFNRLNDVEVKDPFLGITPESRLRITEAAQLRPELTIDRLNRRVSLREQLAEQQRVLEQSAAGKSLSRYESMAYSLLTSATLREAMDVGREPMPLREAYGMTLFGQAALTGRRLLEAGCTLVSVFWDEVKVVNTAWDTHFNHTSRLRDELLPGLDAALSALLTDLDQSGMLDDTLVMCLTEHGRTPRLTKNRGGGRNHWSKSYSVMLAGAGIKRGAVVGATNKNGTAVDELPIRPEDILATMYHLAGVSPETILVDRLKRPIKVTAEGRVVSELLA